jgi:hypothetical protein
MLVLCAMMRSDCLQEVGAGSDDFLDHDDVVFILVIW